MLGRFRLCKTFLTTPGGRKSKISEGIDSELYQKGWVEKKFDTAFVVDGNSTASPTHAVDCYKNKVALEIEWNNKDPFFDRDLNNFRLLFELRVISVGVLFGVRGSMRTLQPGRTQVNLFGTRKREHSRKPDEFYDLIEECSPGPYLELFARFKRQGWHQWGNEDVEQNSLSDVALRNGHTVFPEKQLRLLETTG